MVEFLLATVLVYTAHAIYLYSNLLLSAQYIHRRIKRNHQVLTSHCSLSKQNKLSFELLAT